MKDFASINSGSNPALTMSYLILFVCSPIGILWVFLPFITSIIRLKNPAYLTDSFCIHNILFLNYLPVSPASSQFFSHRGVCWIYPFGIILVLRKTFVMGLLVSFLLPSFLLVLPSSVQSFLLPPFLLVLPSSVQSFLLPPFLLVLPSSVQSF